jgi:hypothetical protein
MKYVQLTIEFVAQVIEVFCQKKEMEVNKKDIKKAYSSLVNDNAVEKTFFCGAECTKSKLPCMKKVDDDGMSCHVHDPKRKCQGTTVKGANCGSVAKLGETHCKRHQDQDKKHSNNVSKNEKPKRKPKKNQQESSDEETSDDEEDIIVNSFPLSSKVLDITSKKNVPQANTGGWETYTPNPAFLYAKNLTVNGKYIIKLNGKNLYIVLCPPDLMGKNCKVPEMSEKEAYILEKMGLRQATASDVKKIEQSSADDNSDDNTSDDDDSDDDSSDDEDSGDEKSNNKPDVESGDDTSEDNSGEVSSHEKPSKGDDNKTHRKKKQSKKFENSKKSKKSEKSEKSEHSKSSKKAVQSSNVNVSEDAKDEHTFALAPMVRNIISAENVPLAKDGGWKVHPNNDMFEYATNFTMKGKYIVKLCGKNKYVGLFTLEHLRGGGDVPEMDVMERSMLSKMKLQHLSDKERKILYNEESEVEEEIQVKGPLYKVMMKWKKLNKYLEYSKNVLVSGKHMLKFCNQDIVIGLMTDDHILLENVEFDTLSLKEKEKILTMGFHPQDYKHSLPEEDKPVEKVDDEVQESNIMGTAEDGGPMESKNVNDLSVYSTQDDRDFLKAMGQIYSQITAIEMELREEYTSAEGSADEKALTSHLALLEKEYSDYEIWHKEKFDTREPHQDILYTFLEEGSKNRRAIVQNVFDSIQAQERSKNKQVPFEVAEE